MIFNEQYWRNQDINHFIVNWSGVLGLSNYYPSFKLVRLKKCQSVQNIVPYNSSIPGADSKPRNDKGQIRLPPADNLSGVWGRLGCSEIPGVYGW